MEVIEKRQPAAIENEQWLLGSILVDGGAFDEVSADICTDDFTRDDHRRIWKCMAQMSEAGTEISVKTLFGHAQRLGEDKKIGGLGYLSELASAVSDGSRATIFAQSVRESSSLRSLAQIGSKIADRALSSGVQSTDVAAEAERLVSDVMERSSSKREFHDSQSVMEQVRGRLISLMGRTDASAVTGAPTGFADLDQLTSGLQSGDLIIVAGRPSMGKTAFAVNVAEHVAIAERKPVAIFSLEMSAEQLGLRMLSSIGKINIQSLRTGEGLTSNQDVQGRIGYAINKIVNAPIYIGDSGYVTLPEVRSAARRLHKQVEGLGLIVIDYIQLMHGTGRSNNRNEMISEITRGIKLLARELNVPIIALSQLSRGVEQRQDKRPMMSDLRESGAIEQDADLILMMYRDEYYNPDSKDRGLAEIIISKHRNGPTGTIKARFQGEFSRFSENRLGG